MRREGSDIRDYEGLVISTAALLVDDCDDDFDDIAQVLRITVHRAILSYDSAKARQPIQKYVFMCVLNRRKDIGSRRRRPEESLDARLEREQADGRQHTEAKYLRCDETDYAVAEDQPVRLPSTLDELEVRVILLGLRDYNQTEVARELGLTRQRVRDAQRSIREKMADWRPAVEPRPLSVLSPPVRPQRQAAA